MFRKYFCQTRSGQDHKDRVTICTNADSDNLVFGFESDTAPCNVYLNEAQVTNLVELLTTWLKRDGAEVASAPKLWEDA